MKRIIQSIVLLTAGLSSTCFADSFDYTRAVEGIARDIANLRGSYPQLKDFSVSGNLTADEHKISYGYHTHRPELRGGWTSGVPNPDEDGIWFYIDFHSPSSTAQIHTQPMTLPYCIGDMRLSWLSLEGAKTKPVGGVIAEILKKHGAIECGR
ncbi:MAG TPA: hypothetical protein VE085_01350 [Burkholderiales bacterium]|nr:hypothetical protein [Burkholderiales bacterium]